MEAAQGIPKVMPVSQTPKDTATALISLTLRQKLYNLQCLLVSFLKT